jgi:hypothetical protein
MVLPIKVKSLGLASCILSVYVDQIAGEGMEGYVKLDLERLVEGGV